MLTITNLHASVHGKAILNGLSLEIKPGEVHAIMGPNGSGKSTLSHVLAGKEGYEITEGSITFDGKNLPELAVDERARAGLFLAFQYPVEIPGVNAVQFLRSAVNAHRRERGEEELDAFSFLKLAKSRLPELGVEESMLKRGVNHGFSGGEKKRFDMLQMALLEPKLAILDETDSGLDIDALKLVADVVNQMRDSQRSFLIITHYQRLLSHIVPDHVHVLAGGTIIASGGKELALELEEKGYGMFGIAEDEAAA